MILNGGLWRVCFWIVRKLLILERETGVEPATSSLGTPHGPAAATAHENGSNSNAALYFLERRSSWNQ